MIKPCRKCGLEAEHYKSIPTCCKECWKERVRNNRTEKVDYYREYDRARSKEPYRKALFIEKTKRLRSTRAGLQSAHNKVRRAVASGQLVKPLRCERCGAKDGIQGHHDDYAKPLDVMWLCPICHAARHKELGRLAGIKKDE